MQFKRSFLATLALLQLISACLAQEHTTIVPRSDSADAAFLRPEPGQSIELKLNQGNDIETSLLERPAALVVFRREGYLDCLIPVIPKFLESGFPGNFTNLERYYKFKVKSDPENVKVYEISRSADNQGQKNFLGNSLSEGLRLDRAHYYDGSRGTFHSVKLLFEQQGYEPYTLEISAKELVPSRELPQITLQPKSQWIHLWRTRSSVVIGVGLLSALAAFAAGLALSRRRRSESSKEPGGGLIGAYEKLESIGKGGTAEVFRARAEDGLEVALKLMLDSDLDAEAKGRFRREVQASLQFQHPNFARIYDWGETKDGRLYLVSELLKGETLSQRLKSLVVGPERDGLIASVIADVGKALAYLHSEGVVHRDVKPTNIFLNTDGQVKLIDLGLARGAELDNLTRTGVAVGSPHYMSPEQVSGDYTPQSDQYALGVMAFEILAGFRPFQGSDAMELLHKHLTEAVPNLRDTRDDLSLHLASVVSKMMAKKPGQRFASVQEALEALLEEFTKPDDLDEGTQAILV